MLSVLYLLVQLLIMKLYVRRSSSSDGELTLGGIHMDHFSDDFVFARLTDAAGTWQITMDL